MKIEEKRIFISDFPETATQSEVETIFQEYGKVKSVEIKERKELGPRNSSLFFAYINIDIDDRSLQNCFKEFSSTEWHGRFVQLQIARESFIDRLKREREANTDNLKNEYEEEPVKKAKPLEIKPLNIQFKKNLASSSQTNDNEEINNIEVNGEVKYSKNNDVGDSKDEFTENFKIKHFNKNMTINRSKELKIESVGKAPILIFEKSDNKRKNVQNQSDANLKRLQSINEMKKNYQNQKSFIQAALSKIDSRPNKIIFDHENKTSSTPNGKRKSLFDDDVDDENFDGNFNIKEQFQGKKGQQLLELQSKYKNDKRFQLDERFLEETDEAPKQTHSYDSDDAIEEEKKREYEILGKVLGKTVTPKFLNQTEENSAKKVMLRFDPSQPEHSKYEIQTDENVEKNGRKRKDSELNIAEEKKKEVEMEKPDVSKDVFYKVTDNLKETFHEKEEFSLLKMFGATSSEKDVDQGDYTESQISGDSKNVGNLVKEKNPFRYDSTDEEDETEDIPTQNEVNDNANEENRSRAAISKLWQESFFFKEDDYRLQEGFDFLERMKTTESMEFHKLRKDLKGIVKAKVRNNQRKNKPFKKKLGGNRKRKMIRIKKALKR